MALEKPLIANSLGHLRPNDRVNSNGNGSRPGQPPIKVLHIINDLSIGGTEIMLYKLLSQVNRSVVEPSVISLNGMGPLGTRITELGISVQSLEMRASVTSAPAFLRLARAARRISPQLIQGWMYHGNLAAQFAGAMVRRPVKVAWNIRQSLYSLSDEKPVTAKAIRLGARWSAKPAVILNNSQKSVAQHAALGYAANRMLVIPNGFDTDNFVPSAEARASVRAELGVPENAILIGRVGRYHHTKDYPTFLRAAALVLREYPDTQFVAVGKDVHWNNHALRRQVHELGLVERIHLLGERLDMPRLTAAFDIAVSSSQAEGFPNVIGEAMACGVPCVVTDVGDSGWIVGSTGRVIAAQNAEALAAGCRELIEIGPDRRAELGEATRRRIIERYSIASVAQQYESLYSGMLAGLAPQDCIPENLSSSSHQVTAPDFEDAGLPLVEFGRAAAPRNAS